MSETIETTSVVAKLHCANTHLVTYGNHHKAHIANFHAIHGTAGENKDFTDVTPTGNIEIHIADGKPAADFFKPGKSYYVTFSEASEA